MDKKYILIALVAVSSILLYHRTRSEEITKTLTMSLSNGIFLINLKSNPTTGASWSVINIANPEIVQELSASYQRDDVPAGVVGSGGTTTFVFKALQKGTTTITFVYKRSWEQAHARMVTYHITIN